MTQATRDINAPTYRYGALAVLHGIKAHVKLGLRVNSAYTPANMARTATAYTGKEYKTSKAGLTIAYNDLAKLLGKDPL